MSDANDAKGGRSLDEKTGAIRNGLLLAVNCVTKFIEAFDSLRNKGASWVCLFQEFLKRLTDVNIITRPALSPNDGNRLEGTITFIANVVSQLLKLCVTGAVISKAKEEIRYFKKSSLTWWNVSGKVLDSYV